MPDTEWFFGDGLLMNQKVIGMDIKLLAMLAGDHGGQSVTAICAQFGISRQTYYVAQRRHLADGVVGLLGRSRRPASSPGQTPAELEQLIVRLRVELTDSGLDNGAQSIWYRLTRLGVSPPAVSTIHRVLRRQGLVLDAPAKRPRSSWIRFGFPRCGAAHQRQLLQPLAGGQGPAVERPQ